MRRFFLKNRNLLGTLFLGAVFLTVPDLAHAQLADIATGFAVGLGKAVSVVPGTLLEVIILPLASGFLYLAGSLMDAAINFSLNTSYIFSLSPAINLGWVIIRDLANIIFIFILIWISINTIVSGTRFGTMSMLKNVVIAALLINFSLFFTKAIIDVSNVFGNWLYGGVQNTLVANSVNTNKQTSLSALIASRMNIIALWGDTNIQPSANAQTNPLSYSDPSKSIVGRVLRLIVVLIATYIFCYIAGLFLARSITLLFLLVFSPLGFLGEMLPSIKEYSDQWWKELSKAGIFPVAFLLMLYISLQFINSIGALDLKTTQTSIEIAGINFNLGDYFQYFIIIFLLKASLDVANKYSGEVGKAIGGAASSLGKLAVGASVAAATGGTAWLARNAIGGVAGRIANSSAIQNASAKGGIGGLVARTSRSTLKGVAGSSFDLRGTGILPKEATGKAMGIDFNKIGYQKDGYVGAQKAREEAARKFADELKATDAEKAAAKPLQTQAVSMADAKITEANSTVIKNSEAYKDLETKNKEAAERREQKIAEKTAEAEAKTVEENKLKKELTDIETENKLKSESREKAIKQAELDAFNAPSQAVAAQRQKNLESLRAEHVQAVKKEEATVSAMKSKLTSTKGDETAKKLNDDARKLKEDHEKAKKVEQEALASMFKQKLNKANEDTKKTDSYDETLRAEERKIIEDKKEAAGKLDTKEERDRAMREAEEDEHKLNSVRRKETWAETNKKGFIEDKIRAGAEYLPNAALVKSMDILSKALGMQTTKLGSSIEALNESNAELAKTILKDAKAGGFKTKDKKNKDAFDALKEALGVKEEKKVEEEKEEAATEKKP